MTQTSNTQTPARTFANQRNHGTADVLLDGQIIGSVKYSAACWWAYGLDGEKVTVGGYGTSQEAANAIPVPAQITATAVAAAESITSALAAAKNPASPAAKIEFPADIEVKRTENPNLPFSLVATDDNPSHLGTWKITENQAYGLLLHLAQELGATIVTAGQQQDLAEVFRTTIADADAQDALTSPSATMLNAHRDRMRDLRDTFRRAGIITG